MATVTNTTINTMSASSNDELLVFPTMLDQAYARRKQIENDRFQEAQTRAMCARVNAHSAISQQKLAAARKREQKERRREKFMMVLQGIGAVVCMAMMSWEFFMLMVLFGD